MKHRKKRQLTTPKLMANMGEKRHRTIWENEGNYTTLENNVTASSTSIINLTREQRAEVQRQNRLKRKTEMIRKRITHQKTAYMERENTMQEAAQPKRCLMSGISATANPPKTAHLIAGTSNLTQEQRSEVQRQNRLKRKTEMIRKRITHQKSAYIQRQNILQEEYVDIGDPTYTCEFCGAIMWYQERALKNREENRPKFSLCCMKGKVQLPLLKDPPQLLSNLILKQDPRSNQFIHDIRSYNMMFSFTSMGGRLTENKGQGPYVYRLNGQNCHRIGSLLPEDEQPKFSQLYIYDTENEETNRINAVRSKRKGQPLNESIVRGLKKMIDENNPVAKIYRMTRERIRNNPEPNMRLRLIFNRESDGRTYNLPTTSEVAALIVDDIGQNGDLRDIIIETRSKRLKCINELHPLYLPL